jgi:GntR family transcriptional regulator
MHIVIEPDDPRPVFKQIVDEVQRCITTGILRGDDPLPAVRELAKQLRVNPNTVQQAYRELERSGAAYVRRGVGTFVGQVARSSEAKRSMLARQIAGRFLREGFRHGLLASDLVAALQELAPSAPSRLDRQEQITGRAHDDDIRRPSGEDRRK